MTLEKPFQGAAAIRDAEFAKEIASPDFLDRVRREIDQHIGRFEDTYAIVDFPCIKKTDRVHLQSVFDRLKQEYPELDHFRIRAGCIVFDTKPDTWLRRVKVGSGPTPGQ